METIFCEKNNKETDIERTHFALNALLTFPPHEIRLELEHVSCQHVIDDIDNFQPIRIREIYTHIVLDDDKIIITTMS